MDAGLCSRIIHLTILACLTINRPNVHHSAETAAEHAFPNGFAHVETTAQIDVEHLVPLRAQHFSHGGIPRYSSVVHQNVHRTKFVRNFHDRLGALIEIGDV